MFFKNMFCLKQPNPSNIILVELNEWTRNPQKKVKNHKKRYTNNKKSLWSQGKK